MDNVTASLANAMRNHASRVNVPHPGEPGMRVIGFSVVEAQAGLAQGLLALDALLPPKQEPSPFVADALRAKPHWKRQSFEYYAAHYLVGSGLVGGDLDGHLRSLAALLRQQYDVGTEHGRTSEDFRQAAV